MVRVLCAMSALAAAWAQQVGQHSPEQHPPMPLWTCTRSGCSKEAKSVVLDANWRWVHNGQYTNCYKDSTWDASLCPDGQSCARNCHLDGVDSAHYVSNYGIKATDTGLELAFVTRTGSGSNFGSRVYLMDGEDSYRLFRLKNREFTMTVDVSRLPCGLNGAVYFVEMDRDGGRAKSQGANAAGAKYGTGYCDAQCPHDMKFIGGVANSEGWNATSDPPVGKYGSCCAEMDIWEANSRATAYTSHPCSITGSLRCSGTECGDNGKGERYKGVCDKDGCDFNSYRMGAKGFYGLSQGGASLPVDTAKPITIVTQFITRDGSDTGDLVEIKRFYVQDGRTIPNSESSIGGVSGSSLTDGLCDAQKQVFGDINDHKAKGGLKAMGEALDRGMVLVFSLWDDSQANMLWLDSAYPTTADPATPGVLRGPCNAATNTPAYVRATYPDASVKYYDVKVGEIGTTLLAATGGGSGGGNRGGDDKFGDNRRLGALHV